jgi:hypothetical protein
MLADVSGKLITQFADCLAETITGPPQPAPESTAEPVEAAAPPQREAEAVDLLRVAGSTNAAKRYAAYAGGLVVVGVLVWLIIRLLRR